jgi:hypothetical protein
MPEGGDSPGPEKDVVPAPAGKEPKDPPEQKIPGKPISDMDPPGQDNPDRQAEAKEPSAEDGSVLPGKLPKLRYF